jgi:two-component system response regulator RegA
MGHTPGGGAESVTNAPRPQYRRATANAVGPSARHEDETDCNVPRRRRYLIVEDNEGFGKTLRNYLERWGSVTWTRTFDEAVAAIRVQAFSAVLVDVRLPGRSGFEVLEELRKAYPQVPVMVLTGYFEESHSRRACELGAQYVAKPISHAGLATFIEYAAISETSLHGAPRALSLSRANYEHIQRVIASSPSRRAAAKALGITPRSLRRMLAKAPPRGE